VNTASAVPLAVARSNIPLNPFSHSKNKHSKTNLATIEEVKNVKLTKGESGNNIVLDKDINPSERVLLGE
jgi:hypothetical protein